MKTFPADIARDTIQTLLFQRACQRLEKEKDTMQLIEFRHLFQDATPKAEFHNRKIYYFFVSNAHPCETFLLLFCGQDTKQGGVFGLPAVADQERGCSCRGLKIVQKAESL
ncbi:MAG: hypothetical protein D9V46_05305 [Deltaproteobacteria bacterium]|uniref:hypothetical protein n=1 Tax=Hydrosulfovibrio ferrireducens TaxID=2934181 RepID=UPI001204788B|nr:MAG: hypothetical protein D9V46_05305 [Deltaproteobacteria bacterium]